MSTIVQETQSSRKIRYKNTSLRPLTLEEGPTLRLEVVKTLIYMEGNYTFNEPFKNNSFTTKKKKMLTTTRD